MSPESQPLQCMALTSWPSSSKDVQCSEKLPHCIPTVQMSRAPITDLIVKCVEEARGLDVSIMDRAFAEKHPFLHAIRCASNLLTSPQKKSRINELLATKHALVSQMVEVEREYNALRCELREEEGDDVTDAYCRSRYGFGDGHDVESELAIAHMELTFRPPPGFPGLDD